MNNRNSKKTLITILLLSVMLGGKVYAQPDTSWNKKSCAVVLTYDDGLNIDLTNVIPALDSAGLKGTFYISDYSNNLSKQINGWRKASINGHELANHSIWHPCEGGRAGREFVTDYDLRYYTVKRMTDEIREMNNVLQAIDGKTERTFAYPCGDTKIHDSSYIDPVKNEFVAARGVSPEMHTIDKVDLYNVGSFMINGQTGDQLIDLVKKAQSSHTLLVFLFHGVGGEHSLNVSSTAHSELVHYLQNNQKTIWVAPMIDVSKFIKARQSLTHKN